MDYKQIKKPLAEIFSEHGVNFSENNTGELMIDPCFNCGRSKKLYASAENGVFKCQRCGIIGGPAKLLMGVLNCSFKEASIMLYGKAQPQSIYNQNDDDEINVQISGIKKSRHTKKELPKPMKIPFYMKPLKKSDIDAWNYLKKVRGLPDNIIEELEFLHWEDQHRVVLPVTMDGETYGTLSRDYIGDQELKVLNSSGTWRSFTVWNYDKAVDSEILIICEGVFSAMKTGIYRSVALFGKTASDGQIEAIRSMKAKKIYICLDVGTDPEQYKLYQQLSLYYPGRIYKIELPPVIENKNKTSGKEELVAKINQIFYTELNYIKELNQYYMTYEDKQNILKHCRVNPKSSTEEKHAQFKNHVTTNNSCKILSEKDVTDLKWLLFKSDYKDSGDYTFDQMQVFIDVAKPFQGGPTNW